MILYEKLQKQLAYKCLTIKKGVIQVCNIHRQIQDIKKPMNPVANDAKYTASKDGKWAKKGNKSYFGYKLHIKIDTGYELIREIETTPANTHDSKIDLSKKEEVAYLDKGYFGVDCKAYNVTMDRASRNKPLTIKEKRRIQKNKLQKSTWRETIRRVLKPSLKVPIYL
ncbi:MAG: transposase [Methanobrevibacter sp.]|jgi:IS5 family transposase|nr:transposase [Candidatus Methanovirga aequatorialis]